MLYISTICWMNSFFSQSYVFGIHFWCLLVLLFMAKHNFGARIFWRWILTMSQILNVFLIKNNIVNPNVAVKKNFSKKKRFVTEKIYYFTASYKILLHNHLQF